MVKIESISYSYGKAFGNVLENVSFEIDDGMCIAVLGNNGAGKSTLLKCIDRILPTPGGAVFIDGQNAFEVSGRLMAQKIAYIPQNTSALQMTVFDTVLLGRKPYIRWDVSEEDRRIANDIIHRMNLDKFILRNVSELSGGEVQKVMLARALAQDPRLLLLDEPTSNLDPRNQHESMQLVRRIAREKRICVITILHDLNLAIRYCDRFLFLKDAKVYAYGGHEVMTSENIENVYGMHVHLERYMGIPIIIPFPDEKVEESYERS